MENTLTHELKFQTTLLNLGTKKLEKYHPLRKLQMNIKS